MLPSRFRLSLALGAFAAMFTMIAVDVADARGRISLGSRGTRTYRAPPATVIAPTVRPMERTAPQPTNPAVNATPRPAHQPAASPTNRPGFAGGLLGAGLFGLVLGAGLTGGLGSLASFLGLALQIGIIAAVVWALLGLWQGRGTTGVRPRELQPQHPSQSRSTFGLRNAGPR